MTSEVTGDVPEQSLTAGGKNDAGPTDSGEGGDLVIGGDGGPVPPPGVDAPGARSSSWSVSSISASSSPLVWPAPRAEAAAAVIEVEPVLLGGDRRGGGGGGELGLLHVPRCGGGGGPLGGGGVGVRHEPQRRGEWSRGEVILAVVCRSGLCIEASVDHRLTLQNRD
jgi:hypothetical protein